MPKRKACKKGQRRSRKTGRCKKPCGSSKTINPSTGRCVTKKYMERQSSMYDYRVPPIVFDMHLPPFPSVTSFSSPPPIPVTIPNSADPIPVFNNQPNVRTPRKPAFQPGYKKPVTFVPGNIPRAPPLIPSHALSRPPTTRRLLAPIPPVPSPPTPVARRLLTPVPILKPPIPVARRLLTPVPILKPPIPVARRLLTYVPILKVLASPTPPSGDINKLTGRDISVFRAIASSSRVELGGIYNPVLNMSACKLDDLLRDSSQCGLSNVYKWSPLVSTQRSTLSFLIPKIRKDNSFLWHSNPTFSGPPGGDIIQTLEMSSLLKTKVENIAIVKDGVWRIWCLGLEFTDQLKANLVQSMKDYSTNEDFVQTVNLLMRDNMVIEFQKWEVMPKSRDDTVAKQPSFSFADPKQLDKKISSIMSDGEANPFVESLLFDYFDFNIEETGKALQEIALQCDVEVTLEAYRVNLKSRISQERDYDKLFSEIQNSVIPKVLQKWEVRTRNKGGESELRLYLSKIVEVYVLEHLNSGTKLDYTGLDGRIKSFDPKKYNLLDSGTSIELKNVKECIPIFPSVTEYKKFALPFVDDDE